MLASFQSICLSPRGSQGITYDLSLNEAIRSRGSTPQLRAKVPQLAMGDATRIGFLDTAGLCPELHLIHGSQDVYTEGV